MRRVLAVLLTTVACALPYTDAATAKRPPKKHPVKKKARPKKKAPPTTTTGTTPTTPPPPVVVVTTKDFTGPVMPAGDYGTLQVEITVEKTATTTGGNTTVTRKITAVETPLVPGDTARSVYISQHAIPTLVRETLDAQSASLAYLVSGATYTSRAFVSSLQAALLLAQQN
jgi:uncharacterized protein with FMN-binding domain